MQGKPLILLGYFKTCKKMQITQKTNTNNNNDLASRFDKLNRKCSNSVIDKPNTKRH